MSIGFTDSNGIVEESEGNDYDFYVISILVIRRLLS